ncbi:hypothetical protein D3870_00725 [Noviherbaspirillum cavernae]|uniref:Uncharacterized protein n=1 Tax=Noviherbaspirillum cavernae TaxID=2320862 RepID=A0A418WX28_9BURK|nr:hypothetical protein D3870_00725 [Noviherbaspirillum cavernae]
MHRMKSSHKKSACELAASSMKALRFHIFPITSHHACRNRATVMFLHLRHSIRPRMRSAFALVSVQLRFANLSPAVFLTHHHCAEIGVSFHAAVPNRH